MKKEVKQLLRDLERAGWKSRKTGSGHNLVKSPEGKVVVVCDSPSDSRSLKNSMADLKRAGYQREEGR